MNKQTARETAGRTYKTVRFLVHCRRVGTVNAWSGISHYQTEDEAKYAISKMGQRFTAVGALVIDTGDATELYEYRIVRSECLNTVTHTELVKI